MSEIKFHLIDSQQLVTGTFHAAIGDRCVAALSAEPETIAELEAALTRFQKLPLSFTSNPNFSLQPPESDRLDYRPWDAGILIIDLVARVVACDSTYSQLGPIGEVEYHDGTQATDLPIRYQLPDDWLFLDSVDDYQVVREGRRQEREANPPLDVRAILYGRPLLEFIADSVRQSSVCLDVSRINSAESGRHLSDDCDPLSTAVTDIHARWLMTERKDLHGQSPREVILDRHDFVDFDLESRAMQWSFQLEGPPCISRDSFAYRFAGFGTHELVLYYGLVRNLIWSAFAEEAHARQTSLCSPGVNANSMGASCKEIELDSISLMEKLEQLEMSWLSEPNDDLEGRIPFILIDNERKRLPEAMGGRSMVIDEDCPCCKMMGDESEAGLGVWFFHLDGSEMDDAFPFSTFTTIEEWEAEQRRREEFNREFDCKWKERQERLDRGEPVDPDPFFDPPSLDEFFALARSEPEIPEA